MEPVFCAAEFFLVSCADHLLRRGVHRAVLVQVRVFRDGKPVPHLVKYSSAFEVKNFRGPEMNAKVQLCLDVYVTNGTSFESWLTFSGSSHRLCIVPV